MIPTVYILAYLVFGAAIGAMAVIVFSSIRENCQKGQKTEGRVQRKIWPLLLWVLTWAIITAALARGLYLWGFSYPTRQQEVSIPYAYLMHTDIEKAKALETAWKAGEVVEITDIESFRRLPFVASVIITRIGSYGGSSADNFLSFHYLGKTKEEVVVHTQINWYFYKNMTIDSMFRRNDKMIVTPRVHALSAVFCLVVAGIAAWLILRCLQMLWRQRAVKR